MRANLIAACLIATASVAHAQEGADSAKISVELNNTSQVEAGCQLTFMASSDHAEGVEKVVFETVLIDTNSAVTALTLFDFGDLPASRPRVRQFVMPKQQCSEIGRVLINGVAKCLAPGLDENACENGLTLTTRTNIELIG